MSGVFSETPIPEAILNFHILQHHHNKFIENLSDYNDVNPLSTDTALNPAENFEKIIINLCFTGCSKNYKEELIKFCREYFLSSGLIYLCLQTFEDQGPAIALRQLRDFYQQVKQKEVDKNDASPFYMPYTVKEIMELDNMPANMSKRELIEHSSSYLGYKLLWAIRLFLLGKKFPKGTFEMNVWNAITHDVCELITQEDFIATLVAIDAEAYFQTISIVFNNPSKQYSFLKEGRINTSDPSGMVMSNRDSINHSTVLERLHEYSMQLEDKNQVRLEYLFFVASIAKDVELHQDKDFFYTVTLELLNHSLEFLTYNKLQLNRQMTGKQLYRKLSRGGNNLPDDMKHYGLTEDLLE